ncbi:uncharacterized protein TRIADDRAFT_52690 [Trichoplax adhaerens]|uniref:Major facilitator superfamily (MFS) profile domain-containing protein n=1 Tax=Trichoplax adhaerens TaxID=10228 RepID=B3RJV4_TRIAD|nr:hypothetical protein TRIADDRAFT_52690 [Trichoplax adhaerens]EDV29850.1 hypothetical protein TRIADDRAFT_52690 [Trichoplax adhaerens]|eukprot:XP_002109052.1 hypothetical protein TRIADDRAFT_52690 [Trichoplax adhaerens]
MTCFTMSLANNMDRNVVSGVLPNLKRAFQVDDQLSGLIQTLSICGFLLFAPIFGYLGDRYNRNHVMAFGMLIWSSVIMVSSFIPEGSQHFWLLLLLRATVGIGEASFASNAPSIFADLFTKDNRSRILALFNLGISIGSGLGYWTGTTVNLATHSWRAAFRIAPCIGGAAAIVCALFNANPPHGEADIRGQISKSGHGIKPTSLKEDIIDIIMTKTFIWTTIGFTCQLFATGVMAFWGPSIIFYVVISSKGTANLSTIGSIFGLVLCISGIVGTMLGAEITRWAKKHGYQCADVILCAIASGASGICIYAVSILISYNMALTWAIIFVTFMFLCMVWTPILDIVLYTIIPARRSTAQAFQITISHLFGDAFSPYVIGAIADSITTSKDPVSQSYALRYAMMASPFLCIIGCGCFLIASFTLVHDQQVMISRIIHISKAYSDPERINKLSDTEVEKLPIIGYEPAK